MFWGEALQAHFKIHSLVFKESIVLWKFGDILSYPNLWESRQYYGRRTVLECVPFNPLLWISLYLLSFWPVDLASAWRMVFAQVVLVVKNPPANEGDIKNPWVWSLGREDPLEEEMATHSSILAWRIPWTEEPGGLQAIGSQSQTQLKWFSSTWRMVFRLRKYDSWYTERLPF